MNIKQIDLLESFKITVKKTNELEHEWNRLYKIEEKLIETLDNVKLEVLGLDKAIGMSSIIHEARQLIEKQRKIKQLQANELGYLLGIGDIYKMER